VFFLPLNTRKRIIITEEQLILVVQQLLGQQLRTEQGALLKIVYLGRREINDGPDFQRALVLTDTGQLLSGDIEVHVYTRDWYRHGHHHNSKYNDVILHIVAQQHPNIVTCTENGNLIPVLCLPRELFIQPYLMQYHQLPCYQITRQRTRQNISSLLDTAGKQRFMQKAMHFKLSMQEEKAGQVLYQGIMRALGYSHNMRPFEKLARIVPLSLLEKSVLRESVYSKQARLLGAAGLLSSQLKTVALADKYNMEKLETLWKNMDKGYSIMSEDEWQSSHIYPNNSPTNRILALGHLLQSYYRIGLLAGILQLVYKAVPAPGHPSIREGLMVHSDEHFLQSQKYSVPNRQILKTTLLGPNKAAQIEVNIILPFAFGWGETVDKASMKKKAFALYLQHREMAGNSITHHMQSQLGLKNTLALTACQQQGLIHIYKTYCHDAKCSQCLLCN
jgi:hypothetical protein